MTYWVIGGTSGIGKATAGKLAELGLRVSATGVEADITSRSEVVRALRDIEENNGPLEGVVYSAGINRLAWLGQMGYDGMAEATDVIDVNLVGFIELMDLLAFGNRREERPLKVVAVSSDAATRPMRTSMAYCASKAGLDMAVKVAARELGPHGWRVNAVSPGMTAPTGMSEYIDERVPELRGWSAATALAYEEQQAVVPGRIGPEDVADVIVNAITGPDHLNGSIITINGGR